VKNLPRISLVTPSCNQAAFLDQAIESVLSQEYPDLEYQVLDGGSTDGSAGIIRKHANRLYRFRSEPDGGQAAALAEGFRNSTGEVLGWLNSDDYLEPGSLLTVGSAFAEHPEVDLVYGDVRMVGPSGARLYVAHLVLDLKVLAYESPFVAQPAMYWRRATYQRAGGIDASYRFAMDFDLVLRMLLQGARPLKLRRVLANFRVHPASKTGTQQAVCDQELERARAAHGLEQGGTLARAFRRWGVRAMRFGRDPRCIWSAIESRLRPLR
jgi:glycosyltransferase involved in cell wall biosynthesis